jgi:hypothetical protein
MKPRISGKQATQIAQQASERRPVRLAAPEDKSGSSAVTKPTVIDSEAAPPRVSKPFVSRGSAAYVGVCSDVIAFCARLSRPGNAIWRRPTQVALG